VNQPNSAPARPVPVADAIDRFIRGTGHVIAWAYVLLIATIVLQVTLRKGFSSGMIMLEELQWHLYALCVMFGLSYAQVNNAHIRVDLLYGTFRARTKYIIEIIGILFFALPFIYVVIYHSLDFVADSYRINERSDAPSGLPWRWAVKAVIPVAFSYLALAMLSRLIRDITLLFKGEK